MGIKTWNATALTGGAARALDAIPTASLTDGDRAFVGVSGTLYYYEYDSAATTAESSPSAIRPDDYVSAGVWVLQRWFTQVDSTRQNLVINSDFSVNQEGYAANGVASLVAGAYGHDMWRNYLLAGHELIYTKNGAADITINSITAPGAVASGLYHKNDELIAAAGEVVTLSFEVVSLTSGLTVLAGGMTPQAISTTGVKTFTFTASSTGDFRMYHTFSGAGTYTPNFRFKNLKIEYGSNNTEYQVPEPVTERLRCLAYYWITNNIINIPANASNGNGYADGTLILPVPMVQVPTFTDSVSGLWTAAGTIVCTTAIVAGTSTQIIRLRATRGSGTFTGDQPVVINFAAGIEFNARY